MKNKAIAPILKKMKVGDKEEYQFRQYSSLRTTIERVQKETGMMFSIKSLEKTAEVTRIK